MYDRASEASEFVLSRCEIVPEVAIVLGSGLAALADSVEQDCTLEYGHIPNFPVSTAVGHPGEMVTGTLAGKPVAVMRGRFHFYEGYTMKSVAFPVRVFQLMGVRTLVLTNACGGINKKFKQGDLMAIVDHINLMGDNPLIGLNEEELGPRFPDMTEAYAPRLLALADEVAAAQRETLRHGVYAGVMGPSFETPAEIEAMRKMGADAVGMSTVPEVIVARHAGIELLAISCVTNVIGESKIVTAEEVLEVAARSTPKLTRLVEEVIERL
ncbi:MAG: purine-nucleoside phosphorylase [Actinobacteria bacterium]|nr:MAG: purine-nucleoside phosphorylase [Actinomycetota bacterium]